MCLRNLRICITILYVFHSLIILFDLKLLYLITLIHIYWFLLFNLCIFIVVCVLILLFIFSEQIYLYCLYFWQMCNYYYLHYQCMCICLINVNNIAKVLLDHKNHCILFGFSNVFIIYFLNFYCYY